MAASSLEPAIAAAACFCSNSVSEVAFPISPESVDASVSAPADLLEVDSSAAAVDSESTFVSSDEPAALLPLSGLMSISGMEPGFEGASVSGLVTPNKGTSGFGDADFSPFSRCMIRSAIFWRAGSTGLSPAASARMGAVAAEPIIFFFFFESSSSLDSGDDDTGGASGDEEGPGDMIITSVSEM
jgi:hypothetical protein